LKPEFFEDGLNGEPLILLYCGTPEEVRLPDAARLALSKMSPRLR
jgi:hypothetical protein